MRKVITAVFAMALITLSFIFIAPAANAGTDKIGICHATGSGKYVSQEVAKDGSANGHSGSSHQNGSDIIPAYSWVENKIRYYFDGQNLDKAALLQTDCKAPADTVVANPLPPIYVPANCMNPELPYGEVVVTDALGEGVASATTPKLNADNTVWSVSYALNEPTEDKVYTWPAGVDGNYTFKVVPITEDPFWETDSKTGKGSCVLPETGAPDYLLPVGGAIALFALGAAGLWFGRKRQS